MRFLPLLLFPAVAAAALPDKVDFNFHVKPILSDRCYFCHGPDDKKREAKLRLDTKEGVFRALEGGMQVVTPGDPSKSALIERIYNKDASEVMPPPESHLDLSEEEKAVLKRWVEQGAEWKGHWSFLPIAPPPVPVVPPGGNAVDGYVSAALAKEGRELQPEATREALIRRAAFTLTGLPPSLAEVDAFLEDTSPGAFEKVVDAYLARPAFGERMAVDWMDVARYADTYGYQNDKHREMSPWRDWVIRAFNDNLPYDQFITWQLAGDLVEKPAREQVLATAFNRLHRQTNEGGSVEEEFRVQYVNDRALTFGSAFLGLTLECSRCHDHKYDPVSMRDFYSLTAFFGNIAESGLYSHFTNSTPAPGLVLSTPEQDAKSAAVEKEIADQSAKLETLRTERRAEFEKWLAAPRSGALAVPDCIGDYPFEKLDGNKAANAVNDKAPASAFEGPEISPGKVGNALHLDGENGVNVSSGGGFSRDDPFTIALWMQPSAAAERAVIFHRSKAWTDAGSQGFELLMEDGKLTASVIHFWPGNAVSIRTKAALPVKEWSHVAMSYDGSSRAGGLSIWVNGVRAECSVVRDKLYKGINEAGVNEITIGQRFRDRGFKGGVVDEFKVFTRVLSAVEIAQLAGAGGAGDSAGLFDYWLSAVDEVWRKENAALTALRKQRSGIVDGIPEIMVMEELAQPKKAYVLTRGAYDSHGDEVKADVPAAVLPWDAAWPKNRLGLAKWTADPRNPLTARVVVNRFWAQMFGRGLVATPEDFGNQGSLPSHPELLDWLAQDFVRSGWNVKHLLRTIALSRTWRQESATTAEQMAADPDNTRLARGPRFRLTAEMLRDQALAVSGLLVPRIGGPSVKPYQPAGIWEEKGGGWSYTPDKGEGLYRRSLYTYWKRVAPPAAMETFDAAKREVCEVKRQVTTTPLQALALLNDVQHLEAARVTAQQLLKTHGPNTAPAVQEAFRRSAARKPTEKETGILLQLHASQLAHFRAAPAEAAALLKNGDSPVPADLDPAELAALTMTVSTVMNHAESTMLR